MKVNLVLLIPFTSVIIFLSVKNKLYLVTNYNNLKIIISGIKIKIIKWNDSIEIKYKLISDRCE